jgi:hypothetical protein
MNIEVQHNFQEILLMKESCELIYKKILDINL